MITFILEAAFCQLVFLLVYDLFLRKETFFNWNRIYLLGTFTVSFILPGVKIDLLRNVLPAETTWTALRPEILKGITLSASGQEGLAPDIPWLTLLFGVGVLISLLLFVVKLNGLYRLRRKSVVVKLPEFTKIIVANSSLAFSFFRNLFIGDRIAGPAREQVIAHERVHMEEWHSLDLLYFEAMRILTWCNPLVYLYQSRVSELHEYIADARIPAGNRPEHYRLLLSQALDTQNISFINHFFQSSLIKKRIVMLKKSRSNRTWKFKYLLLLPVMTLMLCYGACKDDTMDFEEDGMTVADVERLTVQEEKLLFSKLMDLSDNDAPWTFSLSDGNNSIHFSDGDENSYIDGPNGEQIQARMVIEGKITDASGISLFGNDAPVPFGMVEDSPVFPGCEGVEDRRGCFNEQMLAHLIENFNYPEAAREQELEGTVSLIFTIDENGQITDVRSRGPHKLLEEEAQRIIRRLPAMQPGKQQGKAVEVYYSIPITFRLD